MALDRMTNIVHLYSRQLDSLTFKTYLHHWRSKNRPHPVRITLPIPIALAVHHLGTGDAMAHHRISSLIIQLNRYPISHIIPNSIPHQCLSFLVEPILYHIINLTLHQDIPLLHIHIGSPTTPVLEFNLYR
jgi:hypothetical protein